MYDTISTTSTGTTITDGTTITGFDLTKANTISISNPTIYTTDNYLCWDKIFAPYTDKPTKKSEPLHPYDFKYIKEIVPEKVYEFTFCDNTKIKTIREEDDIFNLEHAFQIALAKKLYSKEYTFEGVLFKACQLHFEKKYAKAIKKGMKLFKTLQEEEQKKKECDETKKRQHERYVKRKKAAKERKRQNQINVIAEAIRLSKEGE